MAILHRSRGNASHHSLIRANGWLVLLLLAGLFPLGRGWQAGAPAPVSPAVLEDAADGEADFLIILEEKASLDSLPLAGLKPAEKRQAVYATLSSAAARSQAGLIKALAARGVSYKTYWISNMVAARGKPEPDQRSGPQAGSGCG